MDPEIKKQVLRKLTNGMYVMTAAVDGEIASSTVTWLSQCSFAPPLVMAGIRTDSHLHAVLERSGAFAVNLLAVGQEEVARLFFHPPRAEEGRIGSYAFHPGPETGAPLLAELPAWFEARITDAVRRGDHTVFVAEVVSAGVRNPEVAPLVLGNTKWFYGG